MKERPILFSSPMVRALVDGRKTQTRRVVDWKRIARESGCTKGRLAFSTLLKSWAVFDGNGPADLCAVTCPPGEKGDRLWVRETFSIGQSAPYADGQTDKVPMYRAEWDYPDSARVTWKPSIFMPRWASRVTLEIVSVRVERVQEISEEDAKAEGVRELPDDSSELEFDRTHCPQCGGTLLYTSGSMGGAMFDCDCTLCDTFKKRFAILWDSINAKRGFGWDANPFVWVIEFKTL